MTAGQAADVRAAAFDTYRARQAAQGFRVRRGAPRVNAIDFVVGPAKLARASAQTSLG